MEKSVTRIMQITTKGGIHIQIGVNDLSEYKKRKEEILKPTKDFVTVIDTCTLKHDDISIIEYFEQSIPQEPTPENKKMKGGIFQWLRK